LERLEKHGVVASQKSARGDRQHWTYQLTDAGREEFLAWLAPPLAYDIISLAPDPLRTRMYFLGALTPKRRSAFLSEAREKLTEYIKELEEARQDDEFDRLATRGAIRATKARIAWLDDVRKAFDGAKKTTKRVR